MVEDGVSREDARGKIFLFDIDGLLTTKRSSGVPPHAAHYGKNTEPSKDFGKFVETVKATCIIGKITPSIIPRIF